MIRWLVAVGVLLGLVVSPAGGVLLDVVAPAQSAEEIQSAEAIDDETLTTVDAGYPPDPNAAAKGPPPPDPPDQISLADQSRVRTILRNSPTFSGLIGSRTYRIGDSGYWDGADGSGLSGANASLTLSSPVSRDNATLPVVNFNDCGYGSPTSYQVRNFTVDITGATGLDIDVDFVTGRVVNISPTPDGVVALQPGNTGFSDSCSGYD